MLQDLHWRLMGWYCSSCLEALRAGQDLSLDRMERRCMLAPVSQCLQDSSSQEVEAQDDELLVQILSPLTEHSSREYHHLESSRDQR